LASQRILGVVLLAVTALGRRRLGGETDCSRQQGRQHTFLQGRKHRLILREVMEPRVATQLSGVIYENDGGANLAEGIGFSPFFQGDGAARMVIGQGQRCKIVDAVSDEKSRTRDSPQSYKRDFAAKARAKMKCFFDERRGLSPPGSYGAPDSGHF
jgi:hypothetical protein